APPTSAERRPEKRIRCAKPVRLPIPAKTSSRPKTMASAELCTTVCRAAPTSPPIALAAPNPSSTSLSIRIRTMRKRTKVPARWGSETIAIARRTSNCVETTGVSTLPIPKPEIDAIAPAITAATAATTANASTRLSSYADDDAARDRSSPRPAPQQVDRVQCGRARGLRAPRPSSRRHRRPRHAAAQGARAARRQDHRSRALHLPLAAAGHRRDTLLSRPHVRPGALHADRVHADRRRGLSEVRPSLSPSSRPVPVDQTEGPPPRDPPQLAGARRPLHRRDERRAHPRAR